MTSPRIPVLVSAARTAVGKFNGALRTASAIDLGAAAVEGALEPLNGLVPDHIFLGNVVQAGNGQNPARSAAVRGGVPPTVPATTLNNVCLASMTAASLSATLIRSGELDTALVGGFDSMSRALHGIQIRQAGVFGDRQVIDLLSKDGLWCALSDRGMGPLSDESNTELGISRADQDAFALQSHLRAARAAQDGRFKKEIVPFQGLVDDEGIRPGATLDRLGQLKSAFSERGSITAGNASQMSDAGAAGIIMNLGLARDRGHTAMVEIVDAATIAGPDFSLHLKPAEAAKKLLKRNKLNAADIGLWEINEAFAGVVLASVRELDIGMERVNVNGGAIALGHPLGASGFRLIQTLAREMMDREADLGVAAICGGGGQGQAILLKLM